MSIFLKIADTFIIKPIQNSHFLKIICLKILIILFIFNTTINKTCQNFPINII